MGPSESVVHLLQPVWYPGARSTSDGTRECPVSALLLEAGQQHLNVQVSAVQEGTARHRVAAVGTGILVHLSTLWVG